MFSFFFLFWSQLNHFYLGICLFFNKYSYWFFFIVSIICIAILMYIITYFYSFFFSSWFFLMFLTFFLAILIYLLNFNYFFLFICWELMGICSFFLISSFFFRVKTRFASFCALFWNLVGDTFLLFFILIWLLSFKWISLYILFYCVGGGMLILFSIFCKWAIFPLHAWLFYAMEGPTPVSAFLHAASMITAGVYLFLLLPFFLSTVLWILVFFSVFFFSLFALFFFDLKRIIASSTGSQMGYIFFFLSWNFIFNGFLLLTFHALFKCLLFFLAGYAVVASLDFQDLRSVFNYASWFFFFFLCSASLLGLFYSWCGILKEFFLFSISFSPSLIFGFLFIIMFALSFVYIYRWFTFRSNPLIIGFCIFFFLFFFFLSFIFFFLIIFVLCFFQLSSYNLSFVFFLFSMVFLLYYKYLNLNIEIDFVFQIFMWHLFFFFNFFNFKFRSSYFVHHYIQC